MRKLNFLSVICLLAACFIPQAALADTSYNISFAVGAGSVTGTIQTDGATGSLATSDVTDWNLLLNDGTSTFDLLGPLSGGNSAMEVVGPSFTATASNLLFDFSSLSGGFVLFQNPGLGSGFDFLCLETPSNGCSGNPSSLNLATALGFSNIQVLSESGVQVVGTVGGSTGVPEPGTSLLLLIGIMALGLFCYRPGRGRVIPCS